MDIHDELEQFRRAYTDVVKNCIEKREFMPAYFELTNVLDTLVERSEELYSQIHSGRSLIAFARILQERLPKEMLPEILSAQRRLETYLAQTKLPLR